MRGLVLATLLSTTLAVPAALAAPQEDMSRQSRRNGQGGRQQSRKDEAAHDVAP